MFPQGGEITKAYITDRISDYTVFIPFHYAEGAAMY